MLSESTRGGLEGSLGPLRGTEAVFSVFGFLVHEAGANVAIFGYVDHVHELLEKLSCGRLCTWCSFSVVRTSRTRLLQVKYLHSSLSVSYLFREPVGQLSLISVVCV